MAENYIKISDTDTLKIGKMMRIDIAGKRILLANIEGKYYATDDTCSHEDASLSTGSLQGHLVKCPLHNSRFNLITGEVLEEPAEENLNTYPVKIEGNVIFIALSK